MGFFSFLGRVLFASFFLVSAWQMYNEFAVDGGAAAAKELRPKLSLALHHLSSKLGVATPDVDTKHVVASIYILKGLGGILFVFGSSFGAYLLLLQLALTTPILFDFYNYDPSKPEFENLLYNFTQNMAFFGALLFFIGMKNSIPRRQLKKKNPKVKPN
ncbi:uncharacterized protein LOC115743320 isoform X2 [Rhodamnia argentea]|uniref:Uncharacterized protein LOC115743320 isoform X2 n=1 Tax=Rhodamnia argentea TaxID=178133 RepID=A0A8B8PGH4_9MYRT|nr:uncharacterized protein LOC115743320 isoform X2 [Rhodamnia argentea]